MKSRTVRLVDPCGNELAIAHVADEVDHYGGSIDLQHTPSDLRALFAEFEELVNDQMFSLLDAIEEKIEALSIKAVFDNGDEVSVRDLQVYPSTGDISFKLVPVPAQNSAPATIEDASWPR